MNIHIYFRRAIKAGTTNTKTKILPPSEAKINDGFLVIQLLQGGILPSVIKIERGDKEQNICLVNHNALNNNQENKGLFYAQATKIL